jgi:beta-glucosidase
MPTASDPVSYRFPPGFRWGAATAAYQIEGATGEDGRKDCVWDVWSRQGGTRTGESGAVACDHYHRFEEDARLMAGLGIRHYRLSVAWPRVVPDGRGAVNAKGLDFYDRLIDCLLRHGITPYVTLFHWDLPQALQDRYRGWLSREVADDFAAYVGHVVGRLGDRVADWFTLNEVWCFTQAAYGPDKPCVGALAPGLRCTAKEANNAVLHAMLAHGKGVQAIRAASPRPCRVSLVDNTGVEVPLTESAEDIAAARRAFAVAGLNGQVLWPALRGEFSPLWRRRAEAAGVFPDLAPNDLATIHQPLDGMGFNVYTGGYVRAADNPDGFELVGHTREYPRMNIEWLGVVPEAIYWIPRLVRDEVGFTGDMAITENGCAASDVLLPGRRVDDTDRIMFLRQYLRQVHRAVAEGLPLKGYFHWSLLDNFEWTWGYAKRFGLVFTDYQTQERIPKASARWYAACIRENRVM